MKKPKSLQQTNATIEQLESKELFSVDLVADPGLLLQSSAFFTAATSEKLFIEMSRESGSIQTGAVVDIASNELISLQQLVRKELTIGWDADSWLIKQSGDNIYFTTYDGIGKQQLWVTDGTLNGTQHLLESEQPIWLDDTSDDQFVLFWNGSERWITAGTPETTRQVDVPDGEFTRTMLHDGQVLNIIFRRTETALELWLENESVDTKRLVYANADAKAGYYIAHIAGDDLYFSIKENRQPTVELHAVNLTSGTAHEIISKNEGYRYFGRLVNTSERVLIHAGDSSHINDYWVSGGTEASTAKTSIELRDPDELIVANDYFYYLERDTSTRLSALSPESVDPTILWSDPNASLLRRPQVVELGNEIIFASTRRRPAVYIRTDGTPDGTNLIAHDLDRSPRENTVELADCVLLFSAHKLLVLEGGEPPRELPLTSGGETISRIDPVGSTATVFVSAGDQYKAYRTDGTEDGTYLLGTLSKSRAELRTTATENGTFALEEMNDGVLRLWHVNHNGIADINDDNRFDDTDVDLLSAAISQESTDAVFDINRDDKVNGDDKVELISTFGETKTGDLDLNGRVDFADFLALSANIGRSGDVGWADGDLNADGLIDMDDSATELWLRSLLRLSSRLGEKAMSRTTIPEFPDQNTSDGPYHRWAL